MRIAGYILFVATVLTAGCMSLPPNWPGGQKQTAKVAKTEPATPTPVRSEDVTETNGHAMATALRKEMDREEQQNVTPTTADKK